MGSSNVRIRVSGTEILFHIEDELCIKTTDFFFHRFVDFVTSVIFDHKRGARDFQLA